MEVPTKPLLSKTTQAKLKFPEQSGEAAVVLHCLGCTRQERLPSNSSCFQSMSHMLSDKYVEHIFCFIPPTTRIECLSLILSILHMKTETFREVYPRFAANKWRAQTETQAASLTTLFYCLVRREFLKEMIGMGEKSRYHFLSNEYHSGKLVRMIKNMERQDNYFQLSEKLSCSKNSFRFFNRTPSIRRYNWEWKF